MKIIDNIKYLFKAWKYRNDPMLKEALDQEDPIDYLDKKLCAKDRAEVQKLRKMLEETKGELREARARINTLKEKYVKDPERKKYWNNKHEKKFITYRRPIWDGSGFNIKQIPITVFITPNDLHIRRELKREDLHGENRVEINQYAPKVYKLVKEKYYSYKYDKESLGLGEWWLLPFETRELQFGDCEDYAHMIASYLIAGGVPSWRVRVTTGETRSGGGHATVYVLEDDMETWRHLNSTTPAPFHDSLSDYPSFGNKEGKEDPLGIAQDKVWESFNDKHAWSQISNKQVETSFKNHRIGKHQKIRGI